MYGKQNPSSVKSGMTNVVNGLTKSPPDGQASLLVACKQVALTALLSELSGYIALYDAVDVTEEAHRQAVIARSASEAQAVARLQEVRAALKGAVGRSNPALSAYGIDPDKAKRALTVEQERVKVARAKATRAARHTMGKRQKEAVTGDTVTMTSATTKGG